MPKQKLLSLFLGINLFTVATFGTAYQDISELGTSAGMIGLGNVGGFTHSAAVVLEAPGGLSHAGNSMAAFYTSMFGDIGYFTGAVSMKADALTFGAGITYENDGAVDLTSENSNGEAVSSSTFVANTAQYCIGIDYEIFRDLNLGLTWTQYERNQSTLKGTGGDLGLGINTKWNGFETILFGKNILGQKVSYNNGASEELITEFGTAMRSPQFCVLFDMEAMGQIRWLSQLGVNLKGVGLKIYPLSNKLLGLNVGYKEKFRIGSSIKSVFCGGISLKLDPITFEYGYDTTDVFQQENQHYFSIALNF